MIVGFKTHKNWDGGGVVVCLFFCGGWGGWGAAMSLIRREADHVGRKRAEVGYCVETYCIFQSEAEGAANGAAPAAVMRRFRAQTTLLA